MLLKWAMITSDDNRAGGRQITGTAVCEYHTEGEPVLAWAVVKRANSDTNIWDLLRSVPSRGFYFDDGYNTVKVRGIPIRRDRTICEGPSVIVCIFSDETEAGRGGTEWPGRNLNLN